MARIRRLLSNYMPLFLHIINIILMVFTTGHSAERNNPLDLINSKTVPKKLHKVPSNHLEWTSKSSNQLLDSLNNYTLQNQIDNDDSNEVSPETNIFENFLKRGYIYNNRDLNKANVHNIRMLQLLGYYKSRNINKKKPINGDTTTTYQYLFPPVLHFGKHLERSQRLKPQPSNGIDKTDDNSKRNNNLNKDLPSAHKDSLFSSEREGKTRELPKKVFAFTSNHWGPMGKRMPFVSKALPVMLR